MVTARSLARVQRLIWERIVDSRFSAPVTRWYRGFSRRGSSASSWMAADWDCQLIQGCFSSFITTLPLMWLSKQPLPRDASASASQELPVHTQAGVILM